MNEYYLVISIYNKDVKDEYILDINYKAFDELEAKNIANLITKNLENFKRYTLFRKDYNIIKRGE